jgi:hypothetical protein
MKTENQRKLSRAMADKHLARWVDATARRIQVCTLTREQIRESVHALAILARDQGARMERRRWTERSEN